MILPTMTPEEKCIQMTSVADYFYDIPSGKRTQIFKKLRKLKVFPSYYMEDADIPNMGKWTIIYQLESKQMSKLGVITMSAYQKYYVTHSNNHTNIGTGVYLCVPNDYGFAECRDISPHYFNRVKERLIEAKGITYPTFQHLVKIVHTMICSSMNVVIKGISVTVDSDGTYSIEVDNSINKKSDCYNFISYHKEGISLGICTGNENYTNYTTFISNSLLKKDQKILQKEYIRKLQQLDYDRRYNPFASIDDTTAL